jgi:20S proteasome subunit beta 1
VCAKLKRSTASSASQITPLADKVYILRSGSAADTQAIAGFVQLYIAQHQAEENEPIRVKTAANMARQLAYQNKDALQVCAVQLGLCLGQQHWFSCHSIKV